MKKLYLLAFMAATTLGLSAQTQNVASQAPKHASIQTETDQSPAVKALTMPGNSLLRSTNTQQLDSIIRTVNGENYLKFVYEYTPEGKVSVVTAFNWDATAAKWENQKFYSETYTYDENGKRTRTVHEELNGDEITIETTLNVYDQQGRLSYTDFLQTVQEEKIKHNVESFFYGEDNICHYFSDDSTFNNAENKINIVHGMEDRYLDDAGNIVKCIYFTFDEWQGEQTLWYIYAEEKYTYDELNRQLTADYTQTLNDGTIYATRNIIYNYADDTKSNYTAEQWTKYPQEGTEEYIAAKYERNEESDPITEIASQKMSEDAEWGIVYTDFLYYNGGSVANETIKADTPALKAYAADGTLFITLSENAPVQVYSVTGVCHYNATASGNITIANLPAGIYIVKAGDETVKISVR